MENDIVIAKRKSRNLVAMTKPQFTAVLAKALRRAYKKLGAILERDCRATKRPLDARDLAIIVESAYHWGTIDDYLVATTMTDKEIPPLDNPSAMRSVSQSWPPTPFYDLIYYPKENNSLKTIIFGLSGFAGATPTAAFTCIKNKFDGNEYAEYLNETTDNVVLIGVSIDSLTREINCMTEEQT